MVSPATRRKSAPLEGFPLEILENVCGRLAHCDSRRHSLFSFSLASKRCCAAAERYRFETISISVRSEEELHDKVEAWRSVLGASGSLGRVRCVEIVGTILPSPDKRSPCVDGLYAALFGISEEDKSRQDDAWTPLARLIEDLSGLRDLVYASSNQLARTVLATLHRCRPNSRLHMRPFVLRTLYQKPDHPHNIDPDEFALATSPNLCSIIVPWTDHDSNGIVNYHADAVLDMVTGYAPNLRHVWAHHVFPSSARGLMGAMLHRMTHRRAWRGFFTGAHRDTGRGGMGRLRSLVLSGLPVCPVDLARWRGCSDLTALRSLELRSAVTVEAVQALKSMSERNELRSLRELYLYLPDRDGLPELSGEDLVADLLGALHPLERLEMEGDVSEHAYGTILQRHGESLLNLHLRPDTGPCFLPGHVVELRRRCPKLRELEMVVEGDKWEFDRYALLGTIPHLNRVFLWLDYSAPSGEGGTDTTAAQEKQELAGVLNGGVSASAEGPPQDVLPARIVSGQPGLRSVFEAIRAAGASAYPERSPPLERLRLGVTRHRGPDEPDGATRWWGRQWICEHGGAVREAEPVMSLEWQKEASQFMRVPSGLRDDAWGRAWPD